MCSFLKKHFHNCFGTPVFLHTQIVNRTYVLRAFPVAGPTVWNSLQPDELRDPACDVDSFKQFYKTILFSPY